LSYKPAYQQFERLSRTILSYGNFLKDFDVLFVRKDSLRKKQNRGPHAPAGPLPKSILARENCGSRAIAKCW